MQRAVELTSAPLASLQSPTRQVLVALAVIFNDRGEVLLTQRNAPNRPAVHGYWEVPGGKVEPGESPARAAERELFEETGLEVVVDDTMCIVRDHIWHDHDNGVHTILVAYRGTVVGGAVRAGDQGVASIAWVSPSEANARRLLPNASEFIAAYSTSKERK